MRRSHVLALVAGALLVVPGTAAAATRGQPVGVEAAKPYFDSRTGASSKAARARDHGRRRAAEHADASGAQRRWSAASAASAC